MHRFSGFSLMELMVVVAIASILAAIAYPAYQEHIRKSRRSECQTQLLNAAQQEERFFTQNNRFTGTLGQLNLTATSTNRYCTLGLAVNGTNNSRYTLTTIAQGDQAKDKDRGQSCTTLTLNSLGDKTPLSSGEVYCWSK
ncbi:type IV pilus assembly protein PilE [Gammaproteobacteria bacterium]